MATIDVNRLRPGMKIVVDNDLWVVTDFQLRTPGNLRSFVVCKIKNIRDGRVVEKTFRGSDSSAELAEFEQRTCQYLYNDQDGYVFMDGSSYEQFTLSEDFLGLKARFLMPDSDVVIGFWDGKAVDVILPAKMTMTIVDTFDAVTKGNSSGNITKDATLDSGLVIQVPSFVKNGEKVIVSTEDGSYVSRA